MASFLYLLVVTFGTLASLGIVGVLVSWIAEGYRKLNRRRRRVMTTYLQNYLAAAQAQIQRERAQQAAHELAAQQRLAARQFLANYTVVVGAGGAGGGRVAQRVPPSGYAARLAGHTWTPGTRQVAAVGTIGTLEAHYDAEGRFHREDGPALVTTGLAQYFYWHGNPVYGWLTDGRRNQITWQMIGGEHPEIVPALLDMYLGATPNDGLRGEQRVLRDAFDAGGVVIRDRNARFGTLFALPITDDDPLVGVRVVNSTTAPDGTREVFWLRVPPDMPTARAAVAWSFGLAEDEYCPEQES